MARREETQVLVVGAGPVGLFTALCLAELGLDVMIVDEEHRGSVHAYALALHAASRELLAGFGLAEPLVARGREVTRLAVHEGGERRAELPLDGPLLVVPQSTLEEVLRSALEARGVRVGWERRLATLDAGRDGAVARVDTIEHVSGGYAVATTRTLVVRSSEVHAAFVVGADGHHSAVRRQLGIGFPAAGDPALFAVFEFVADLGPGDEAHLILHGDTLNGLWPLGDGRWRFSFQLHDGELVPSRGERRAVVQIGQRAYPQIAERRLAELVAERAPWFDAAVGEVPWSVGVRFERRLAESFGAHSAWLAGDAAHVTVPLGMQSMNVGLHEGSELAGAIAGVVRYGRSLASLVAFGSSRHAAWRGLLGIEPAFAAGPETPPWVAPRVRELVQCLPASGPQLDELAGRLGLVKSKE